MIAILKAIGPVAALIAGLVGGASLTGAAAWAWNAIVDNPQVAREAALKERHQLTVQFMREAEEVAAAERARQRQVIDDTIAAYEAALEAGEAARRAADEQRDKERRDYEQKLRDAGRSCVVTDDDFEWLRRQRD